MSDIRSRVQSFHPDTQSRDLKKFVAKTGNIYEALVMMSKRSNEIGVGLKNELREKLDEFAIVGDTIEEVQENKEQIEISKFYERLPNPAVIAINEFLSGQISVMDSVPEKGENSESEKGE